MMEVYHGCILEFARKHETMDCSSPYNFNNNNNNNLCGDNHHKIISDDLHPCQLSQ